MRSNALVILGESEVIPELPVLFIGYTYLSSHAVNIGVDKRDNNKRLKLLFRLENQRIVLPPPLFSTVIIIVTSRIYSGFPVSSAASLSCVSA